MQKKKISRSHKTPQNAKLKLTRIANLGQYNIYFFLHCQGSSLFNINTRVTSNEMTNERTTTTQTQTTISRRCDDASAKIIQSCVRIRRTRIKIIFHFIEWKKKEGKQGLPQEKNVLANILDFLRGTNRWLSVSNVACRTPNTRFIIPANEFFFCRI